MVPAPEQWRGSNENMTSPRQAFCPDNNRLDKGAFYKSCTEPGDPDDSFCFYPPHDVCVSKPSLQHGKLFKGFHGRLTFPPTSSMLKNPMIMQTKRVNLSRDSKPSPRDVLGPSLTDEEDLSEMGCYDETEKLMQVDDVNSLVELELAPGNRHDGKKTKSSTTKKGYMKQQQEAFQSSDAKKQGRKSSEMKPRLGGNKPACGTDASNIQLQGNRHFLDLPEEVLLNIMQYLPCSDLISLVLASPAQLGRTARESPNLTLIEVAASRQVASFISKNRMVAIPNFFDEAGNNFMTAVVALEPETSYKENWLSVLKFIEEQAAMEEARPVIACGSEFCLAVAGVGEVITWGSGEGLGDGTDKYRAETKRPQILVGLQGVSICQVSAGEGFAMALSQDGRVFTWGSNSHGQHGQGIPSPGPAYSARKNTEAVWESGCPREVHPLFSQWIVQIAAGGRHAVAVSGEGAVFTWGDGSVGQLGNGPEHEGCCFLPQMVEGLAGHRIVMAAAGDVHTVVLNSMGEVWTFGSNTDGQLGTGDAWSRDVPTHVTNLPHGERVKRLGSLGPFCYATVCITKSGQILTWGANPIGHFGRPKHGGDMAYRKRVMTPTTHSIEAMNEEFRRNFLDDSDSPGTSPEEEGEDDTNSEGDRGFCPLSPIAEQRSQRSASSRSSKSSRPSMLQLRIEVPRSYHHMDAPPTPSQQALEYTGKVRGGEGAGSMTMTTTMTARDSTAPVSESAAVEASWQHCSNWVGVANPRIGESSSSKGVSPPAHCGTAQSQLLRGARRSQGSSSVEEAEGAREWLELSVANSPVPTLMTGPMKKSAVFTDLAMGPLHMVAMDEHGRLLTGGWNWNGQLGNGSRKDSCRLCPVNLAAALPASDGYDDGALEDVVGRDSCANSDTHHPEKRACPTCGSPTAQFTSHIQSPGGAATPASQPSPRPPRSPHHSSFDISPAAAHGTARTVNSSPSVNSSHSVNSSPSGRPPAAQYSYMAHSPPLSTLAHITASSSSRPLVPPPSASPYSAAALSPLARGLGCPMRTGRTSMQALEESLKDNTALWPRMTQLPRMSPKSHLPAPAGPKLLQSDYVSRQDEAAVTPPRTPPTPFDSGDSGETTPAWTGAPGANWAPPESCPPQPCSMINVRATFPPRQSVRREARTITGHGATSGQPLMALSEANQNVGSSPRNTAAVAGKELQYVDAGESPKYGQMGPPPNPKTPRTPKTPSMRNKLRGETGGHSSVDCFLPACNSAPEVLGGQALHHQHCTMIAPPQTPRRAAGAKSERKKKLAGSPTGSVYLDKVMVESLQPPSGNMVWSAPSSPSGRRGLAKAAGAGGPFLAMRAPPRRDNTLPHSLTSSVRFSQWEKAQENGGGAGGDEGASHGGRAERAGPGGEARQGRSLSESAALPQHQLNSHSPAKEADKPTQIGAISLRQASSTMGTRKASGAAPAQMKSRVVQVAAGFGTTLALLEDGSLLSFGDLVPDKSD